MYICHQLSVVCHWVMSYKLHKHQYYLLSSSRSDVLWSSVILLTPCSGGTELTRLLTMIYYYPLAIGHMMHHWIIYQKSKLVMSLTSCTLWDKTVNHKRKHYSQTVLMNNISDLDSMSLTHWYQCHQTLPHWKTVATNLCFTQLFISNLKHDKSGFHVKALECYLPPDGCLQVFIIPYEGHLPPCPPIIFHLNFPMLMCSMTKKAYPEMWKFWKNCTNGLIPCQTLFMFQNMSKQCQC